MASFGQLILLPAWLVFLAVWLVGSFRTARTVRRARGGDRILLALIGALAVLAAFNGLDGLALARRVVPDSGLVLAAGVALTYGGIGLAIWARVHLGRYWSGRVTLKEGHKLVRSGPYAYVRNPIYAGILAAFLGSALVQGTVLHLLMAVFLLLAFVLKIRSEEGLLRESFGEEYAAYEREVKRLVPGLW